nr:retinol dehydrogenase 10-like [Pelodiscus sinensis]|eukprot:XP_006132247.1 retinol dehydrogenase 10-like [Pelodiscus sinensis]
MGVLVDFLLLTANVVGYIIQSLVRWIKRPTEKRVTNEICLITGTASAKGLGRLFALEFAQRGATLVLWDIDADGNEKTAVQVRELGARAYAYTCDVSQREDVYNTAQRVRQEVGDVTFLINNAGVVAGKPILQCSDELLERTMKTNCHAHFWTVKAFMPKMMEMDHGHIVTVAGCLGLFATAYVEDYCASKFAVVGFHEALSHQLKAKRANGVKTTLVCPSLVNTGMFTGYRIRQELDALLPSLQPGNCVKTAMKGILSNQPIICIPRAMYFAVVSKHLLPWDVQVLVYKFLGIDKCMYPFVRQRRRETSSDSNRKMKSGTCTNVTASGTLS